MTPKYLKIFSLLFFLIIGHAHAEDDLSGQGVMAMSKITGACGILDSMIYFQKTTQMPGGDDFVSRFWVAEAARLGLSMQEYSDRCNKSIAAYNKLWEAMESTQ